MKNVETVDATASPRSIPGPRGIELYRLLPDLAQRPHESLLEIVRKYGDIVLLRYPLESFVLLAKPEYIEHVLHHRHTNYDKLSPRWKTLRQVWGDSLLTSDGDGWRRQRQRMQPAFHHGYLQQFAAIAREEAQRVSGEWSASAATGEPRDVYRDMLKCAIRTITRAAFGSDIEARAALVVTAVEEMGSYINPVSLLNLLNAPLVARRLLSPHFRRFRRSYALLNALFNEIIQRRLREPAGSDLLAMLMTAKDEETSQSMTAGQLYDEMMGILMAGHETTGIATAWSWYWMSQVPEVRRALETEIDTVLAGRPPTYDDIPGLAYTNMVLQEALRIAPPTWAVERRAREDDRIDGFHIPRGTTVGLSQYVMHHHPAHWEHPEAFNPLRFLPEAVARRPQYAYFPFGGGPRRCVGMRFALAEAVLILATLAQSFRVRMKPGHPVEASPRLNLPPKYGLQMIVERRAAPVPAAL